MSIKLYKRENGRVVAYHEAWVYDGRVIEHWGPLGEHGETREHALDPSLDLEDNLMRVLHPAGVKGFMPIDIEDHAVLLVEYLIDGWGTEVDLQKRHDLEMRLSETTGWAGIGHVDGGSIGSGSMEVCCFVVDFDVAKRVIEQDLAGTEFADYSRIYCEDIEM